MEQNEIDWKYIFLVNIFIALGVFLPSSKIAAYNESLILPVDFAILIGQFPSFPQIWKALLLTKDKYSWLYCLNAFYLVKTTARTVVDLEKKSDHLLHSSSTSGNH